MPESPCSKTGIAIVDLRHSKTREFRFLFLSSSITWLIWRYPLPCVSLKSDDRLDHISVEFATVTPISGREIFISLFGIFAF